MSFAASATAGESAFKVAARPAQSRSIAEWAEENFVLDARSNARPGPIDLSLTPYMRGILEAFQDWHIRDLTFKACTQVGKTTVELICLGWTVDQKPAPTMFVTPTEMLARRFSTTRIKPLFDSSPALDARRPHEAWSEKILEYHLDRMSLLFAWANSPAALSGQPAGVMLLDEVDKYPQDGVREADADDLADERLKTFDDSKIMRASTPTLPDGTISAAYEESDQRHYHAPCPHCGTKQKLVMGQLKWPADERSPSKIKAGDLAWYECSACLGKIEDTDKPAMLNAGEWVAENPEVTDHAGFHLNTLYSPFVTFSEVAAKFLRCKGNPRKLRHFTNSWMGEAWEEQILSVQDRDLAQLEGEHERGWLPEEAQLVTMGVDWHAERKGYVWMACAFGHGRRQWVVDHGAVHSLEELDRLFYEREWATPSGIVFGRIFGGVDSGWDTPRVYDWVRPNYPDIRPTKGRDALSGTKIKDSPVDYRDDRTGKHYKGFSVMLIDTNYYKDLVASRLSMDAGEQRIILYKNVDKEFVAAMKSEKKVRRKGKDIWVKRYAGAPNHPWDCLITSTAMADREGWNRLRPLEGTLEATPKPVMPSAKVEESSLSAHLSARRH